MSDLPKIESEGLRLAKEQGAASVSSAVNVSMTPNSAGVTAVERARIALQKWRPTTDNTICRCAGNHVCEYHELTDAIDGLLALPHPQASGEWQTIESAPKDGTKIILFNERWETLPIAFWDWGEGPDEDGTGGWCAWHTVDDRFPGAEDGIIYPSENFMPTHWQPIPSPQEKPR